MSSDPQQSPHGASDPATASPVSNTPGPGAARVLLAVTSFVFMVVGMKLTYGAMSAHADRPLERAATGLFGLALMLAASGVLYWTRKSYPKHESSAPPPPPPPALSDESAGDDHAPGGSDRS